MDEMYPAQSSQTAFAASHALGAALCLEVLKTRAFGAAELADAMDAIARVEVNPAFEDLTPGDRIQLDVAVFADREVNEALLEKVSRSADDLSLFMFALSAQDRVELTAC